MLRRSFTMATAALPVVQLAGCGVAEVQTFPTLAAARHMIAALGPRHRSDGAWLLPQVLNHLAQSVEYSIDGYPELKSALFRSAIGSVAFAVFEARGKMGHSLSEPIPGAPALDAQAPLEPAKARLLAALQRFEAHEGEFAPHFAYGSLDKPQYLRAHLMHLANHWTEVVPV
jgi:hypothetical protein